MIVISYQSKLVLRILKGERFTGQSPISPCGESTTL